jgi:sporulation protein YlmC with PRC-barrel domain
MKVGRVNGKIQLVGTRRGGMAEILAENLSGKAVTGEDGAELGMLYNITMDLESGKLEHLIINPAESYRGDEFNTDPSGRPLIPVSRVKAVKDRMIIER